MDGASAHCLDGPRDLCGLGLRVTMMDCDVKSGGGQFKADRPTDALRPASNESGAATSAGVSQPGRTR